MLVSEKQTSGWLNQLEAAQQLAKFDLESSPLRGARYPIVSFPVPSKHIRLFKQSKSDWMIPCQSELWKADLIKNFLVKKAKSQQSTSLETLLDFCRDRWPSHEPFHAFPNVSGLNQSIPESKGKIPTHLTPLMSFLYSLEFSNFLILQKEPSSKIKAIILCQEKLINLSEDLGACRILNRMFPCSEGQSRVSTLLNKPFNPGKHATRTVQPTERPTTLRTKADNPEEPLASPDEKILSQGSKDDNFTNPCDEYLLIAYLLSEELMAFANEPYLAMGLSIFTDESPSPFSVA